MAVLVAGELCAVELLVSVDVRLELDEQDRFALEIVEDVVSLQAGIHLHAVLLDHEAVYQRFHLLAVGRLRLDLLEAFLHQLAGAVAEIDVAVQVYVENAFVVAGNAVQHGVHLRYPGLLPFAFGNVLHDAEGIDVPVIALHQVKFLFEADGRVPVGGDGPVAGLGTKFVVLELLKELFGAGRFQEFLGFGEQVFFCPLVDEF